MERSHVRALEADQGVLQIADAVAADLRLPLSSKLVEHGLALPHERVSALGHGEAGAPDGATIWAAEDVSVLFQEGDRLGCRLFRDRCASADLGDRVSSGRDRAQREIMGGTNAGMPSGGKSFGRFLSHEPESPEQQQRQVRTTS